MEKQLSEKLPRVEVVGVLSFLIGKIPVRYASAIYLVADEPLRSPLRKLIYSSCTD